MSLSLYQIYKKQYLSATTPTKPILEDELYIHSRKLAIDVITQRKYKSATYNEITNIFVQLMSQTSKAIQFNTI